MGVKTNHNKNTKTPEVNPQGSKGGGMQHYPVKLNLILKMRVD